MHSMRSTVSGSRSRAEEPHAAEAARNRASRAEGDGSDPHGERRHSFRVHTEGCATLWHKQQMLGSYTLHDLCLEGCALEGAPACPVGAQVELALHLSDRPAPLWLAAEVRRIEEHALGLRFARMQARVEDRLQDLVVDEYARAHDGGEHFSLVIDARPALRAALTQSLDTIGERAVGIATPLDAVQLLLERSACVHTAFIGPQAALRARTEEPRASAHQPGFELAEFLARNYPHIRRVLIGDASEVAESWVASATGEAHAVLELPCQDDALRLLVHRIAMLPRDR